MRVYALHLVMPYSSAVNGSPALFEEKGRSIGYGGKERWLELGGEEGWETVNGMYCMREE